MRIARGLSQTQLAEGLAATGVGWFHQVTIGRIENAQRPTTLGEAYSIAEFFGVDLHEMTAAEVSTETFARADVVTAAVSIRDEADRLHRLADALIRRALAPVADPDPHTTSDKEQT
jgi:transcriptional regulator with XRE-family HTH domain